MKQIKRWFSKLFAMLLCALCFSSCVLPGFGSVGTSDTSALVGTYELAKVWSEGIEASVGDKTSVWGDNLIIKRDAVTLTLTDKKFELCFNERLLFDYDKLTFSGRYTLSDKTIRLRYSSVEIVDGHSTMKQFQLFPVDISDVFVITVEDTGLLLRDPENARIFTLKKVEQ